MNPFKYGKIFDSTITRLVLALVLLLPWSISFCHRTSPDLLGRRCALIAPGALMTDSVGAGTITLQRGDSVTLMGVVDPSDSRRPLFWVQTDRGDRGYLPQECITDSAYVVNRSLSFSKDSTTFKSTHFGDTITVRGITMVKHGLLQCAVRLASGKDTVIRGTPFVFFLADSLVSYTVRTVNENMEAMSPAKFERQCIGKRFDEIERAVQPALLVAHAKGGNLQAQYPVLVFKDGKFYRPIVDFDADSIAVSYRLPERPAATVNSWLLKYMPFYGKFCDLPMVGAIWSNGTYEESASPISQARINRFNLNGLSIKTLGTFALFFVLAVFVISRALLVPLFLPWLIFGLLRFPPVFKWVGNAAMCRLISLLTIILTAAWIMATLSNYYILLMVVAEFFIVKHFLGRVSDVLLTTCPSTRCGDCRMLYSTRFTKRVEEGERRNAVEEVEEVLSSAVTSVERWQTYNEVTTTYTDGSKKVHKENVKNHSKEHGYYVVGVFREEVVYVPYTNYYTCDDCGCVETSHDEERVVLNRTKLRQYTEHY